MGFADVNRAVSETGRERSLGLEELLDDFQYAERIPTTHGTLFLVPSVVFEAADLPDIDPACIEVNDQNGGTKYAHPTLGIAVNGFQVIAPEHLAALWVEKPTKFYKKEYHERRRRRLPIPPVVERFRGGEP